MEELKEATRLKFLRTVIIGATIATTVLCVLGAGLVAAIWYGALRFVS